MMEVVTLAASVGSLFVVTLAAIGFGVQLGRIKQQIETLAKLEERFVVEVGERHRLEIAFREHAAATEHGGST